MPCWSDTPAIGRRTDVQPLFLRPARPALSARQLAIEIPARYCRGPPTSRRRRHLTSILGDTGDVSGQNRRRGASYVAYITTERRGGRDDRVRPNSSTTTGGRRRRKSRLEIRRTTTGSGVGGVRYSGLGRRSRLIGRPASHALSLLLLLQLPQLASRARSI